MKRHIPVLVEKTVEYLNPQTEGTFVDCTLGNGGHAEELKTQNSKLKIIGIDGDEKSLEVARQRLAKFKGITFIHDNFANLKKIITRPVDGFLFDLGLSSSQLDDPQRGFSFRFAGPLDMRLNNSQKLTAKEIVNQWDQEELEKIFRDFGEEKFSRRVARAIVEKRKINSHTKTPPPLAAGFFGVGINTTLELKEVIEKAIPGWRKRESVARIFQALRIAVNQELENLKVALKDAISLLKPGGRMVVISYHSLEDRMVKHTFREYAKLGILKILTKKPVVASREEIEVNPRAKSAKLRAAEKT